MPPLLDAYSGRPTYHYTAAGHPTCNLGGQHYKYTVTLEFNICCPRAISNDGGALQQARRMQFVQGEIRRLHDEIAKMYACTPSHLDNTEHNRN
jgi:hypothetical protein